MKEDRKLDATINLQAQLSAKGEMIDPQKTVLSLVIDGMDSGKFKIPRRLEATKEFSRLWRPECRFIGCLAEGLTENFFIGDCDLVKNASLDLTLISHVSHQARAELEQRGVALPLTLRLHSDNASSELKNQLAFKWCAWLLHRNLFKEIVISTFRVGHSHSKIDQRFSECRSVLSESANLESPADFLSALQKVKPREGRRLNLEEIQAAADFDKFFQNLEVCVSGHTQTHQKSQKDWRQSTCFFPIPEKFASLSVPRWQKPFRVRNLTPEMSSWVASTTWPAKRIRSHLKWLPLMRICLLLKLTDLMGQRTLVLGGSFLSGKWKSLLNCARS